MNPADHHDFTLAHYQLIIDVAPTGIIVANAGGQIVLANQAFHSTFGYSSKELPQLVIEDLMPKDLRCKHTQYRHSYHAAPSPRMMGEGRDLYAMRKDGSIFPIEIGLNPIEIENETYTIAMVTNITERKQIAEKLELANSLIENIREAVINVSCDGELMSWNPGATEIFGYTEEDALGHDVSMFLPRWEPSRIHSTVLPQIEQNGYYSCETQGLTQSGDFRDLQLHVTVLTNNSSLVVSATDITQRKKLEQEILTISENEQRRIGQDLHDDLCQQLAGISCLSAVTEATCPDTNTKDQLNELTGMIQNATTKARELSRGLVPAVLETDGLVKAIEALTDQVTRLHQLPCTFYHAGSQAPDLPGENVHLYRIAQEAINNAVRHSGATQIDVELETSTDKVFIRISDNGAGIQSRSEGIGLLTMQRRAETINAEFTITSDQNRGTTIEVKKSI